MAITANDPQTAPMRTNGGVIVPGIYPADNGLGAFLLGFGLLGPATTIQPKTIPKINVTDSRR